MQHATNENGDHRLAFDSWGEFIADAEKRATHGHGWSGDTSLAAPAHWAGTPDMQTAVDLARHGWHDGTRRLLSGLDSTHAPAGIPAMHPAWDWDVAGAVPDVGAYCAGVPEHMGTPGDVDPNAQPVTRLYIPGVAGAMVEAQQLERYAVAVASHVESARAGGHSTEVFWTWTSQGRSGGPPRRLNLLVPLIRAGQTMDAAVLAFAFHPSTLRRLAFAVIEQRDELAFLGSTFGRVKTLAPADAEPGAVILPGPNDLYHAGALDSTEAAAEYIGRAIADAQPTYAEAA